MSDYEALVRCTRRSERKNLQFGEVPDVNLSRATKESAFTISNNGMTRNNQRSGTHISWKRGVWHLATFRSLAVQDGVDLRVAEIDFIHTGDWLQHGSPDQRRHEIRHVEGRLLFLDEFPDCLFRDFFADAVGNLPIRRNCQWVNRV